MRYRYVRDPHPHIFIDEIVPPDVYSAMQFPDELVVPGASWGITSDDPQYEDVLRDRHWLSLHDELRGEAFVLAVVKLFAEDLAGGYCLVDPAAARLVPFKESRQAKETAVIATDGDANELFTRLDFQSKSAGSYREFIHLDWARRLVGGILFFSDSEEEGLEGGELAFYRDQGFRNDRWCHDPELVALFPPKKNTGVIFLNSNRGFHGPRAITALRGRRRWLYYTISSRIDIWPAARRVIPTVVAAG
jgi:hypothetical protein